MSEEEELIEPHPDLVRLCEALNLPKPGPWTRAEMDEFWEKEKRADEVVAEMMARRARRAA
ncbi:hypothetical protein AMIS_24740 [Actinoplanes missouriensis 431]|uniref:Uncharacterized protein n=1 Tax=Actinoplanes missouriensis (strain ATCC 14538 / DSM 43046 / CBS 188.64 / JCM 3121 / NBRC 102363 / NCIMB 12654 / NRRL B-3342 / UNCC 431) TaxID=512565 RepID=I0H3V7_ACTM4|nr:hypothetical protein [Actinoplanes missouriensis]BAL87694.1 hypothetical protein AMIS_24740 [Actinoplanes missouriensis 431]